MSLDGASTVAILTGLSGVVSCGGEADAGSASAARREQRRSELRAAAIARGGGGAGRSAVVRVASPHSPGFIGDAQRGGISELVDAPVLVRDGLRRSTVLGVNWSVLSGGLLDRGFASPASGPATHGRISKTRVGGVLTAIRGHHIIALGECQRPRVNPSSDCERRR